MAATAIRRAEFLMVLAYASDLATGQSRDFALRGCVLAMRLADALGLDRDERRNVYHQALLRYVGCNADTHLLAAAFGDEIAMRQDLARIDLGSPAEVVQVLTAALNRLFAGAPHEELAAAVERGLSDAMQVSLPILAGHCEVAKRIGQRIGLPDEICDNLGQLYERWDGKGLPNGLVGNEVGLAVRVVTLAQDAVVLMETHGPDRMPGIIAGRRGGAYEPELADALLADVARLTAGLDAAISRDAILALEPEPQVLLDEAAAEAASLAIADMIDMRMPFTFGHSRAVAKLASAAGRRAGLSETEISTLRRAGYTHDLGELAVPVSTWLKPGVLTDREADAARLHPYHGERALAGLGEDGPAIAALVLRHHERLDGTGYHRGVRAPDLSPAARILAAAEAFQTAMEDRPHRPAVNAKAAAAKLRKLVRDGILCPDGTEAVLAAAGHASRRASGESSSGLTPRETAVLRLIAGGLTAKEAARKLGISPKTADNHIQSLYAKIGVSTRAGAALYALERGLLQQSGAA